MTGQKLIIIDTCLCCPDHQIMEGEKSYCKYLGRELEPVEDWWPGRDTHPDCTRESARGFL